MSKTGSFQIADVSSYIKELSVLMDKPTLAAVAVSAAMVGIMFLIFHIRHLRRDQSLRSEIREYLGTNHSLSIAERTVVDRLTSKVEELESRAAGLEHDIRVIVEHLQQEQRRDKQSNPTSRAA